MKNSLILAIHNLRTSDEFMQDFIRSNPGSRGANIFKGYSNKIKWILQDIITYHHFSDEVREGLRKEMSSDAFSLDALLEKIPLLNPDQREAIEGVIDNLLSGKSIEINLLNDEDERVQKHKTMGKG